MRSSADGPERGRKTEGLRSGAQGGPETSPSCVEQACRGAQRAPGGRLTAAPAKGTGHCAPSLPKSNPLRRAPILHLPSAAGRSIPSAGACVREWETGRRGAQRAPGGRLIAAPTKRAQAIAPLPFQNRIRFSELPFCTCLQRREAPSHLLVHVSKNEKQAVGAHTMRPAGG